MRLVSRTLCSIERQREREHVVSVRASTKTNASVVFVVDLPILGLLQGFRSLFHWYITAYDLYGDRTSSTEKGVNFPCL